MRQNRVLAGALVTLLLGGCMVGPEYKKPSAPMTPSYKEAEGWKLANPSDHLPRGQWWTIFGDPDLNALEAQIEPANQNLRIAEARLREARAQVRFNRAALFPTISANAGNGSGELCAMLSRVNKAQSRPARKEDLEKVIDLTQPTARDTLAQWARSP